MLEVKTTLRSDTEQQRLEIAKDVSAFANSETAGIVVYGLETKRRRGRDRICAVHPFSAKGHDQTVHEILDRLVVPPIEGLETAFVPVGQTDEHVLMVHVPVQPSELRPFLVKGAVVEGKVNGNLIAIYRRRDDRTLAASAEGLHAALAAGFALLRGVGRAP